MEWLMDMSVIVTVGVINILLAGVIGLLWLKNERYPWEKSPDSKSK